MDSRGAADSGASRRTAILRLAAYAALVGLVCGSLAATGSLPSPDEARDWGEGLGDAAYLAYVPLFVVANFVIWWPILAGAAGLLFGTAAGTPLALSGLTAASLTQMFIARRLAAGHHGSLLPERIRRIEDFLTRHGAIAVMQSRIVPLLPYGLVNFSAGLTRLRYRDLAMGTLVGAAPKVFAYVALGGSLSDLGSPEAIIAITLLVAMGLVGVLFVRRQLAIGRA
ncbi:MAG: TVP38/TMEM64 family protein [Thermoleophilaceae bacterium]|nr:TVP38/TMEM64 family protein [Thermoleophilaceae bacterium]